MSSKEQRQAALLELVQQRAVRSQDEMVALLQERGFTATQASVSRDIRELGLVKAGGRYAPVSAVTGEAPTDAASGHQAIPAPSTSYNSELITACTPAGANLVVIRTKAGAASIVAADLDRRTMPEIVGTLAGDDTIFIAVPSRAAQGRLLAFLKARPRP
jgi:transcriptional regulator of arginine metabolism